jgi:hypothetical protein
VWATGHRDRVRVEAEREPSIWTTPKKKSARTGTSRFDQSPDFAVRQRKTSRSRGQSGKQNRAARWKTTGENYEENRFGALTGEEDRTGNELQPEAKTERKNLVGKMRIERGALARLRIEESTHQVQK